MSRTPLTLLAACMLWESACEKEAASPGPDLGNATLAAPDTSYVATPAGWYHQSCVHEVPNGARVDTNGVVTAPDGSTFQIPKCSYPSYSTMHVHGTSAPTYPSYYAWPEDVEEALTGKTFRQLTFGWRVPQNPTGAYTGTQTFFAFPGFEDINEPNITVIQPVIQWGYNGLFGGRYWTAAAWACTDGGACPHSPPITIDPGDSILGTVTANTCVNGSCSWTITVLDVTKGTRSNWVKTDVDNYNWVAGAVESRGLTDCSQFPSTGVFYSGIVLQDNQGNTVSPSWTNYTDPNAPPCGFAVASAPASASLYYLTVAVSGPNEIYDPSTYTWYANPTGGGSYTYQWQYQDVGSSTWNDLGTGPSQTRYVDGSTPDFTIRANVTSGPATNSGSLGVAWDPVTVELVGPQTMNPDDVCPFTATAHGKPPYTYTWHPGNFSETTDGSSTTLYSAPVDIIVDVTDANGGGGSAELGVMADENWTLGCNYRP